MLLVGLPLLSVLGMQICTEEYRFEGVATCLSAACPPAPCCRRECVLLVGLPLLSVLGVSWALTGSLWASALLGGVLASLLVHLLGAMLVAGVCAHLHDGQTTHQVRYSECTRYTEGGFASRITRCGVAVGWESFLGNHESAVMC